jgi:hypothetical protein
MQSFRYRTYGLDVESEIECRNLMPSLGEPQVRIRYGEVPEQLKDPILKASFFENCPDEFLFNLEGVGRFWVGHGEEVRVEAAKNGDDEQIEGYLFGLLFGMVLHQRGILPIHASAIATPKGAVLFMGASGRGKSTLAGEFGRRGYPILADDICAITNVLNVSRMHAARSLLHLLPDSLSRLGIAESGLEVASYNPLKRRFPVDPASAADSVPVCAAYALEPSDVDEVCLARLSGFDKISTLLPNIYRVNILSAHDLASTYFGQIAALARTAKVSTVRRPTVGFRLSELADRLEEDFDVE